MKPPVTIDYHDSEGLIFTVESSEDDLPHTLGYDTWDGWCCTCMDYKYRKHFCKHMQLAKELAEAEGYIVDETVYVGDEL